MLRSASGILGTVEVGNGFPRDGTDGEWKIAGRDAILTIKDGIVKLATAEGDETLPGSNATAPYFNAVRDALDHWQRGAASLISVHDCLRAVRLIDQAYERSPAVEQLSQAIMGPNETRDVPVEVLHPNDETQIAGGGSRAEHDAGSDRLPPESRR
jgi:hypothetical protein